MLISSVYIDNDGLLWFGYAAFDKSNLEGEDGSRQRLDNIKRRLSEEGWEDSVGSSFNPTRISVTYGEMVLAYLMFMTWTVNFCIEDFGLDGRVPRRFALPCLEGEKRREVVERLSLAVGDAQVLADTFGAKMLDGLPLRLFVETARRLMDTTRRYPWVREEVSEPVGVAGSVMSWKSRIDTLFMVVDIGAGTSDFGLFRVFFDPESDRSLALEAEGSSRVLTEAGNHLDNLLIERILSVGDISVDHPNIRNIRGKLNLTIRENKESLFNDGSVYVTLDEENEVEVELKEFLELGPVKAFALSLRRAMVEILESVDESWVNSVRARPNQSLVVMLTGGGAKLPMVQDLARDPLVVNGSELRVTKARDVPEWLNEHDGTPEGIRKNCGVVGGRTEVFDGLARG